MKLDNLIGELIPQNIDQLISESIKMKHPFQHFSTVMISDPNKIIKGFGQSKPNNLISDNFGTWLAGIFRAPVEADTDVTLTDKLGTPYTVSTYDGTATAAHYPFNAWQSAGGAIGSNIQVGSGVTAATRGDQAIETAMGTAPENTVFPTGNGSYAAGAIAVVGAISAGGAGTINETILFGNWREKSTTVTDHFDFLLFHDILVSGEAFIIADTITVTYTINL